MMSNKKGEEVIPSARRLIKSLRDMGYDFVAAVADLVDNAIEANASVIHIDVEFKGDDSWVRIADNGNGMTYNQLKEAMRYGTEREYDELALGKFGLGLKTASLSQCRRLSVVSRASARAPDLNAFSWDLDHIEETNRWEIVHPSKNAIKRIVAGYLSDTTGTVIFWQRLDRILGYKHPYGELARKRLSSMCRDLEQHIAMVFHRFLAGEVAGKELIIFINGNEALPWDPFARSEPKTNVNPQMTLHLNFGDLEGDIILEPYVLPHQDDFSTPDAFRRLSGPANWNQQQGFYIYRSDRLIQSGGWSKLRTSDEHTKLARVALRFSPILDDGFKINVSKMKVQFPPQVKDQIEIAIKPVIKMAHEVYRKSGSRPADTHTTPTARPPQLIDTVSPTPTPIQIPLAAQSENNSDTIITVEDPQINLDDTEDTREVNAKMWTLDELEETLELIAEPDEIPVLRSIFSRIRNLNIL